jgi:hypothetical protein
MPASSGSDHKSILGSLESAVLDMLWASPEPLTGRDNFADRLLSTGS